MPNILSQREIGLFIFTLLTFLYSILKSLSEKEHQILQEFIQKVAFHDKIINEIQKLLFDQHFFARLLKASAFDTEIATMQLKNQLKWR